MKKYKGKDNHPGFFVSNVPSDRRWLQHFEWIIEHSEKTGIDPADFVHAQMWGYGKWAKQPPMPNQLKSTGCQKNYDEYIEFKRQEIATTELPDEMAKSDVDAMTKRVMEAVEEIAAGLTVEEAAAVFHCTLNPLPERYLKAIGLSKPTEVFEAVQTKL